MRLGGSDIYGGLKRRPVAFDSCISFNLRVAEPLEIVVLSIITHSFVMFEILCFQRGRSSPTLNIT